ncbi:MAG: hypothetical protein ACLUFV_03525 [Acutalibacteraceae bacterium]
MTVFDEPEAGIDLWSFSSLIQTFQDIRRELKGTMIIISHQDASARGGRGAAGRRPRLRIGDGRAYAGRRAQGDSAYRPATNRRRF